MFLKVKNKVISSPVYDKAELALYINKVCFAFGLILTALHPIMQVIAGSLLM